MGQAISARSNSTTMDEANSAALAEANTPHGETLGVSYPAGQTPEEILAKALARWREKLRAPGRGLPPADYSYIKLEEVVEENAGVLSRLRELGASTPTCVYFGDITRKQADLSLGRLSLAGARAFGRHIVESFTDDELDEVIDDGLAVPVFDDEGRRYDFRCGYSEYSDVAGAYQLVGAGGDYQRLMTNNDVVRIVAELRKVLTLLVFRFRSAALLTTKQQEGHAASGALCMVILFFVVL